MNKAAAKKKAEVGGVTIADMRLMIASARPRGGMSRVNPSIPLNLALDIYAGALDGRKDDEAPEAYRPDVYHPGHMSPTKDFLIMQNIFRDCL